MHPAIDELDEDTVTPGGMGMLLASSEDGFFHDTPYEFERAWDEFIDPILRVEEQLYELCQPIYITALQLELDIEERFFCEVCRITFHYRNRKVNGYRLVDRHDERTAVRLLEALFKTYHEAFGNHPYWSSEGMPRIGDFLPYKEMVTIWRQNTAQRIKLNLKKIKRRHADQVVRP